MIPKVANFTFDKYTVQCVGIDASKDKLTACLFIYDTASDLGWWTESVEFKNNKTGYNQLVRWSRKNSNKDYIHEINTFFWQNELRKNSYSNCVQ